MPDHAKLPMAVTLTLNGSKSIKQISKSGMNEIIIDQMIPEGGNIRVELTASTSTSGVEIGANEDARQLSVVLNSLVFE